MKVQLDLELEIVNYEESKMPRVFRMLTTLAEDFTYKLRWEEEGELKRLFILLQDRRNLK